MLERVGGARTLAAATGADVQWAAAFHVTPRFHLQVHPRTVKAGICMGAFAPTLLEALLAVFVETAPGCGQMSR